MPEGISNLPTWGITVLYCSYSIDKKLFPLRYGMMVGARNSLRAFQNGDGIVYGVAQT